MRHASVRLGISVAAGVVIAAALTVLVAEQSAFGQRDALAFVLVGGAFLLANAVVVFAVLLVVGVVRRRLRPSGLAVAGATLLVAVALFPVERRWWNIDYSSGVVPLAQSLLMRPLPGTNRGSADGWYREPAIAYFWTSPS